MLKKIKWANIAISLAYVAAGVLLILYPNMTASVVCSIVGVALIVFGVVDLTTYFLSDIHDILYRNEFAIGILAAVFGILILTKEDLLLDLVPILLGLIICTDGLEKMQKAVVSARIGYPRALQYTILGMISIILGVVIMFFLNGQQTTEILFRVIGAGLIYSGVTDLYIILFLSSKYQEFIDTFNTARNKAAGNVFDADASEISAPPAPEEPTPAEEKPEESIEDPKNPQE